MATVEAIAKLLASNDKAIRDSGIEAVPSLLQKLARPLNELAVLRLWKAIFYCFWMSDKPAVQHALAQKIADLIHVFKKPTEGLFFLKAFLDSTLKEWGGIDHLRMDKYLALVRKTVRQYILYVKAHKLNEDSVDQLIDTWSVLLKRPNGLRFHLADVFVDELLAAYPEVNTDTLQVLLMPWYQVLVKCDEPLMFKRLMKEVLTRIVSLASTSEEQPSPVLVNVNLRPIGADMFMIASSEDTQGSHRKPLYALHARIQSISEALYGPESSGSDEDEDGEDEEEEDEEEEDEEEEEEEDDGDDIPDDEANQDPVDTDWVILSSEPAPTQAASAVGKQDQSKKGKKAAAEPASTPAVSVTAVQPQQKPGKKAAVDTGVAAPSPAAAPLQDQQKKGKNVAVPTPSEPVISPPSTVTAPQEQKKVATAAPVPAPVLPSKKAGKKPDTPVTVTPSPVAVAAKPAVPKLAAVPIVATPNPPAAGASKKQSNKKRRANESVDAPQPVVAAAAATTAPVSVEEKVEKAKPVAVSTEAVAKSPKKVQIKVANTTAIDYVSSVKRLRNSTHKLDAVPTKSLLKKK